MKQDERASGIRKQGNVGVRATASSSAAHYVAFLSLGSSESKA